MCATGEPFVSRVSRSRNGANLDGQPGRVGPFSPPTLMRRLPALALLLSLAPLAVTAQPAAPSARPALTVEPTTFTSSDGRTAAAEVGRFRVPENRARPSGRTIGLAFVRFPSTSATPGPPIVYLAGGPGGAGTDAASGTRFDLFQALRSVADVVAFDQRGTGLSDRLPDCPHRTALPLDVTSREAYAALYAETARACAAHWRRAGVDLAAYTTEASADDLDALRQALGADRVQLWAISYGTHLALATIRRHPEAVARAVLAGVEGPDHTLKLPSHQQALLEQIDALRRADDPASTFLADVEAVLGRLRAEPVTVDVEAGGQTVPLTIGAFDVQWLAANMLGGPELSLALPPLFAAMRAGDFSGVAPWVLRLKGPTGVHAMSAAMDAASGASLGRRARIASEARRTLLGDAINFPGPAQAAGLGVADLGPAFRAPVVSSVPVLFISGTLDGRTPVANADEVAAGFSNGSRLVIEGAGHSDPLFLGSPVILDRMQAFLAGRPVADETIPLGTRGAAGDHVSVTSAGTTSPSRPLVPGDDRLDLDPVMALGSQTFDLTLMGGGQRHPFGTLTETIRRTPEGGLVRVQRLASPRGTQVDSLTFGPDLSPRSHFSHNPGRTVELRYSPTAVTGTYAEVGRVAVAVDDARDGPAFDSNAIDLVARAVPLTAGFEADVRTYERGSADATETDVTYTVRVLRVEAVDGRDAAAVTYSKAGGPTTTVWVNTETRRPLRLESEVAPGTTFVMEPR